MGNLQYRSTVWICQYICADSAFFKDVCPTYSKTMMRQNAFWGRYAVYITGLHRHFLSQGYLFKATPYRLHLFISVFSVAIFIVSWKQNYPRLMSILHDPALWEELQNFPKPTRYPKGKRNNNWNSFSVIHCISLDVDVFQPCQPVFSINEQFVMDLMDLQKLAKYNKGYKHLLTVTDVLSKYAWVEPLKSKSATALVEALERLWTRLGPRQPQKVQTDSDP